MTEGTARRSVVRVALGVVSVLALGVIGNGLWERVFAPLTDSILHVLLAGSGRATNAYVNHVYRHVGLGFHERSADNLMLTVNILFVVVSLAGGVAFIWLRRFLADQPVERVAPRKVTAVVRSPWYFTLFIALSAFNIVAYTEDMVASRYRENAVVWIERSMEIVRPCITAEGFFRLRADYRAIDSANAFYSTADSLSRVAIACKTKLPALKVLRPGA